MTDFLLELRSEEIPARMQAKARADLAKLFAEQLAAAGLAAGDVTTYATPRRLALIARGLPAATQAVSEELKGPPEGAPDAAIEGFCRKAGLDRSQLELREVKGRNTWFAVIDKPGRATAEVLAEAIPAIVRAFPWPKSMRWGDASVSTESLRWVRPLHGIVALLGEQIVACEVAGVASGATTLGHRFHHPGAITIGSAADYVEKLRACHVIVDPEERAQIIRAGAAKLASDAGLTLVEDEGLVAENVGLTEWPVPLLGRFDAKLLDAPREILELTLKVNQKYFSLRDGEGATAPGFVCVANIEARDGGEKIVAGNRKVAEARLADAIFFWEQDRKVPLAEQAQKLDRIVFHEKLGTVADKAERVAKLARWLVEEGIVGATTTPFVPSEVEGRAAGDPQGVSTALDTNGSERASREELADLAEQAGRLCKADLVTQTVGEFPEVQGIIGYELAKAQGLDLRVAEAIRDHYKPVGQGDEVPTAPVSVAVALADKLDTLLVFFATEQLPSGSRDPFALRRSALSSIAIILRCNLRIRLGEVAEFVDSILPLQNIRKGLVQREIERVVQRMDPSKQCTLVGIFDDSEDRFFYVTRGEGLSETQHHVFDERLVDAWYAPLKVQRFISTNGRTLLDFFAVRLKVQQREAGVRHDLIDAVFALGGEDDLVRLLARVHALQAFVGTEDGANLLAGYKRAANILKKEGFEAASTTRHPGLVPGSTEQRAVTSQVETWTPEEIRGDDVRGETVTLPYTPEPAEADLIAALDAAEPRAAAAIESEDFEGAMAALASLRAPIDAFFDHVTVNDADSAKREARLALLARMRDAVHRVADFSRIEL